MDNLHKLSKPVSWNKKKEKYFKMSYMLKFLPTVLRVKEIHKIILVLFFGTKTSAEVLIRALLSQAILTTHNIRDVADLPLILDT